MTGVARARAPLNVALVKYWGKRDEHLNLPETGSLSLTLSHFGTTTSVRFGSDMAEDIFILDGREQGGRARERVSAFLDLVRDLSGLRERALVESYNDLPASCGLASSASGYAALAMAASRAAGLEIGPEEMAALARRGSGSAPRSLFPGFVEVEAGIAKDGSDYRVRSLAGPDHMDLAVVIAITHSGPKEVGSSEGMERTRWSSPFYPAWVAQTSSDLERARQALRDRDFVALGHVVETQAFRMHAVALAADPPILYWDEGTLRILREVRFARERGIECFPTMDAGPHVFVLCRTRDVQDLASALEPRVRRLIIERPGFGAEVVD